jgi:hypothetical protein
MGKKILFLLLVFALPCFSGILAQGFQSPAEGKAVIYFVRVTNMSFGVTIEYFQNEKFIGEFKGKGYMRYECDPGEYLFWGKGESVDYMTSDLKAGSTYVVMIDIFFGGHIGFHPVTEKDTELFAQAKAMIKGNPSAVTPEKVFTAKKEKHAKIIPERLKLYNEVYKNDPERHFKNLADDMAIEPDAMK